METHLPKLPFRLTAVLTLLLALGSPAWPQPQDAAGLDLSPVPQRDPGSALPDGWQHGAFMEIFVRAYQDSDGDGIGDLRGLTQRLDYLRDLGVKGIWLMPITASADHDHGYATVDHRQLEQAYGRLEDLDELLRQAHARGIGVIMDYVVNHGAARHPLFIASASGAANRYRDWFVWQPQAPRGWDIWGKDPWTTTANGAFFATFGAHMPDFNLRNPRVVAYHEDSLRFWLNRGLDGYRLDAVPHMIENSAEQWNDQPESRALTGALRALINGYPRRWVVCEATANPQAYAAADVCGSAFAFGHERNIVNAAKGQPDAVAAVAAFFKTAPLSMATMVSNHDIFAGERLWDQVAGDLAQYKLAAATYLLQPGTPFIYYGEEVGMAGVKGLPGDAPLRTPMSWRGDTRTGGFTSGVPFRPVSPNAATHNVAAQQGDPQSLLAFYRDMLRLRNTHAAIAQGDYAVAFVQGPSMGFLRRHASGQALVMINYGTQPQSVALQGLPADTPWGATYPAVAPPLRAAGDGSAALTLPAQSVSVYTLRPR